MQRDMQPNMQPNMQPINGSETEQRSQNNADHVVAARVGANRAGAPASRARASRASKTSDAFRLPRFFSLILPMLACIALTQQAAAQPGVVRVPVELSIADVSVTEGDEFTFTITAEGEGFEGFEDSECVDQDEIPCLEGDGPLNIQFTFTSGTADIDTDLTQHPTSLDSAGSVILQEGETEVTWTGQTAEDLRFEGDETFTVTLTYWLSDQDSDWNVRSTDPTATITIIDDETADVSLRRTGTGRERDGYVTFTVDVEPRILEPFSLAWTASDGTAIVAEDLVEQSGTVTIPANSSTRTFRVPVVQDTERELNETFTLTLSTDPEGFRTVNPSNVRVVQTTATGTISSEDHSRVDVRVEDASAVEGEELAFRLSIDAVGFTGYDQDRTIRLLYIPESADLATDTNITGSAVGGSTLTEVTLPAGNTSVIVSVQLQADNLVEGDETFTVTPRDHLDFNGARPDQNTYFNTALLTIREGDTAQLSLVPEPTGRRGSRGAGGTVGEGGTAIFTVRVDKPVTEEFRFGWIASDGTATVEDDLVDARGTFTVPANTTEVTFEVVIAEDDIADEPSESFTVSLSGPPVGLNNVAPGNVTISPSDNTATGLISAEFVTVSVSDASVLENAGNATVTVTLSDLRVGNVVLQIRYIEGEGEDAALVANDLGASPPTEVTIFGGQASATFAVPITNDEIFEGNETFTVRLSVLSAEEPGRVSQENVEAEITIVDDDGASMVNIGDVSVREDAGNATFPVTLSAPAVRDVVLDVAYAGESADLATDLGTDRPATVTISGGDTTGTIVVPIADDALVEGAETFTATVTVVAPSDAVIADGVATGTITNDDTARVTLSPPTATAAEGESIIYTVELSAAVDEAVAITWTAANRTATVAGDLRSPTTGEVTFPARTTASRTFTIAVAVDEAIEANETFTVTLAPAAPLPDGVTITNATSTTTITGDGPTTPPTGPTTPPTADPTVSLTDARVDEGAGNATFTVTLGSAVDGDVVLDITYAAGSADPATDLGTGRPDAVTIDAESTSATFEVPIEDDAIVEGEETFTVTVAVNTAPDEVTIADGTAEGTIVDDDGSVVTLSPATQSADEDGSFAYTVSLSAAVGEAVDITWTAVDGTATVADDLRSATGTVTFPADTTAAQTFTVAVADDDVFEGDETFTVTLAPTGVLPTGVTVAAAATSTATIIDNDEQSLVNIGDADVDENAGNATFTVTLSEPVDGDVVLGITYAAGSANPATDLGTGRPATVTIDADSTSATFEVPIEDDTIVEGEETFTVTVAVNTAPGGVTVADGTAEGTIADDDSALVTLTPPTQTVAEDGSFSYTVNLSAAVSEAVAVTWTASAESGDTATVADDLQSATGTVTFPADTAAAQTFAIAVADDTAVEENETFTVTISAAGTLPVGVMVDDDNATSTATITDNDTPASVSIADATAAENAGNVTFAVTLSEAVDSNVVLGIAYAAGSADLATDLRTGRPATVTINANSTSATFGVPIVNDDAFEADETFTVTLSGNNLPDGVVVGTATATGTIRNDDFTSVLAEPRRSAAMSALRRHTNRFERVTSNAAHSRLRGRSPNNSGGVSDGAASGNMATGFDFGEEWNGWLDGSFAGFHGDSGGRQVDLYAGADHLSANGKMVWGVMLGIESAQLDVGPVDYDASHLLFGAYGGSLLTDTLIWDGAISFSTATPDISAQGISADYDARRFSIRSDLTGAIRPLQESGALTVAPQVGVSYVRESLGSFVDSAGGMAAKEMLEVGRISAGPRFTLRLDEKRELVSRARLQWDMLSNDVNDNSELSAAVDVGARFNPSPEVAIGIYLEADGIGNSDEYATYGGRFELRARF